MVQPEPDLLARVAGGYLWSPQVKSNGAYNQFYANMKMIEPGDIAFSFREARIQAIGIAVGAAYESPKPFEFGDAGSGWSDLSWRVDVQFDELPPAARVRPKDFISDFLPYLPDKYSPLRANGSGLQSVYLAAVPDLLAAELISRIEPLADGMLSDVSRVDPDQLRNMAEESLQRFLTQAQLEVTEKAALIAARRGQGRFRQGVSLVEPVCRFTGVATPELLVASHIRPWHRCHTNEERLDPFNGLMLTPTYDRLFDKGLISSDNRELLVCLQLQMGDIDKIRMDPDIEIGSFGPEQLRYLEYHRERVFRLN